MVADFGAGIQLTPDSYRDSARTHVDALAGAGMDDGGLAEGAKPQRRGHGVTIVVASILDWFSGQGSFVLILASGRKYGMKIENQNE